MKVSEFKKLNTQSSALQARLEDHLKSMENERLARVYESCPTCRTPLEFRSRTDWVQHVVVEAARCNCCGHRVEPRQFPLL